MEQLHNYSNLYSNNSNYLFFEQFKKKKTLSTVINPKEEETKIQKDYACQTRGHSDLRFIWLQNLSAVLYTTKSRRVTINGNSTKMCMLS